MHVAWSTPEGLPWRKFSGTNASLKTVFLLSLIPLDLATATIIATVVEADEPRPAPTGISHSTLTRRPRSLLLTYFNVASAASRRGRNSSPVSGTIEFPVFPARDLSGMSALTSTPEPVVDVTWT